MNFQEFTITLIYNIFNNHCQFNSITCLSHIFEKKYDCILIVLVLWLRICYNCN